MGCTYMYSIAFVTFKIGMGNYSIILIIVTILLAIIDIICFSKINDNQNRQ